MSTPQVRTARTRLGKLLDSNEDAHREELAQLTHGRYNIRAALDRSRHAVDAQSATVQACSSGPRWTSLDRARELKLTSSSALPPLAPNQQITTTTSADEEPALATGSASFLEYGYMHGALQPAMSTSIDVNRIAAEYAYHQPELHTCGLEIGREQAERKPRTVYLRDDGTLTPRAGVRKATKQGKKKTKRKELTAGSAASHPTTGHNRLEESPRKSTKSPVTAAVTTLNSKMIAGAHSSDLREIEPHSYLPTPSSETTTANELAQRGSPESARPTSQSTGQSYDTTTHSLDAMTPALPAGYADVLLDLNCKLDKLDIGDVGRAGAGLVPVSQVDHYRAVRARHEELAKVSWRCDDKDWRRIAEDSKDEDLFKKLLQARQCWDEILAAMKLEDLVVTLEMIKEQYEDYLGDLFEATVDAPRPLPYKQLKEQYDSTLPDDVVTSEEATSQPKPVDAADITLESVARNIEELEKKAGVVVKALKSVEVEYQQARDMHSYVDAVGKWAQRWRGIVQGRKALRDATSGAEWVLEVDSLQRKILDAIVTKNAIEQQQRRLLMRSDEFYSLQTQVTESKAECERVRRRIDMVDRLCKGQENVLAQVLHRYNRPSSEKDLIMSHISKMATVPEKTSVT
ncbi:uncharacterized protein LOC135829174 [Sycon ciliatum]|uniref:uncharacterized protein LOC135829174 n=1 Tax=Sycon ciliatum TaxID=27933 RepID=UPI0031F698A2